jgi:hypothetical protein
MQFLKKNYEKILLGAVVLVALGIAAFLPILVGQESQKLDDLRQTRSHPNQKVLPPLDLSRVDTLVGEAQSQVRIDLTSSNKLFNPCRWSRAKDGHIFPNPPDAVFDKLEVAKVSPLYEVISPLTVSVTPGLPTHYAIKVQHEAAATVAGRAGKTFYVAMNDATTNGFMVVAAEGPEEDPTFVTLELSDTGERVKISKDQPYKRVEGHTVDLLYPPENKHFPPNLRINSVITFAGESYKIIDIEDSEVVFLQQSNQKQWTKTFSPTTPNASSP